MKAETQLQRFRKRLATEGILRSALLGFGIALILAAVAAVVCWFVGVNALFVALPVAIVLGAGASALLYFKKYRPTVKSVAAKVDELGLEERLITMAEFEGDTSYIAERQRKDALSALEKVNERLLPVAASAALVVCFAVAFLFGSGATTVSALAAYGVLPDGKTLIEEMNKQPAIDYVVKYKAGEHGSVYCADFTPDKVELENKGFLTSEDGKIVVKNDGSIEIKIPEGEEGKYVFAFPDKGYVFAGWSDGLMVPYRVDAGDGKVGTVTANFVEGDFDIEAYLKELEGMFKTNSDSVNKPYDVSYKGDTPTMGGGGNGAGDGSGQNKDEIIDGQTDYGDVYGDYAQNELDRINNDSSIPDAIKDAINGYFDSIKTGN